MVVLVAAGLAAANDGRPGTPHPSAPHVVAGEEEDHWRPEPGYAWTRSDDPDSFDVAWEPGTEHPDQPHLLAGAKEGSWEPEAGFTWTGKGRPRRLEWIPGRPHPTAPNVRAAEEESAWVEEPGYRWTAPDDPDSLDVEWRAGLVHPDHPHVLSAEEEGAWTPEPGYAWKAEPPAGHEVLWTAGRPHPGHPRLVSTAQRGHWAPEPGHQWERDAADHYGVVAVAGPGEPPAPKRLPPAFSESFIDWDVTFEEDIVTGLYGLYGDLLGDIVFVSLTNRNSETITVEVSAELLGFSTPDEGAVKIEPGGSARLSLNPVLNADAVDQLRNRRPAMLRLRVVARQGAASLTLCEETQRVTLHARRDFPWSLYREFGRDAYTFLAAWVTPHDPAVERLIRNAASHHRSESISSGYDGANDPEWSVYSRLEAIWKAMQDEELTYISTPVSFAPGSVQRIRLPAEVIEERSGNCIELSLLVAAAAEALRLDPLLVLLPGHCFVGVALDSSEKSYYFVETTLIRGSTFEAARLHGRRAFAENRNEYNDGENDEYLWVSIREARRRGVFPVPWR